MKATLVLLSAASLLMSAPAFAENSAIGIGRAQAASQSGALAANGNSVANASNNTPKQAPGIAAPGLLHPPSHVLVRFRVAAALPASGPA